MLGLGAYDSSSEEEDTKTPPQSRLNREPAVTTSQPNQDKGHSPIAHLQPKLPVPIASNEAPSGPVLGPASVAPTTQLPDDPSTGVPGSPFSTSRALVHDLTLPPVPNLDIPPSPPGSPNLAANAKFEHFLSLKKQGVHFNAKLANSSSLKNPSLLMKMMEHAGIDESSQYNTSLPPELWSTSNLPHWGFKEELLRAQQESLRKTEDKRASGQRSSVEFVAGSGAQEKDRV